MKESNKDILIALLESILNIKIKELTYLNLEKNVDNINIKKKHFDFHVKTDKENIQIEINSELKDYTRIRNLTYLFDTYSHAVEKGEEYTSDITYIQINFTYGLTNSRYYDIKDNNINIYKFKNQRGKTLVDNIIYYEFNMDYFVNLWYTKNEKEIDKYKYIIMMDLNKEDLENLSKKDRVVERYMKEIERVNEDPEIREWISVEKDNMMIENSLKRQYREEGIAEGRKEKSMDMAKQLKEYGMDEYIISRMTGVSVEDINNIDVEPGSKYEFISVEKDNMMIENSLKRQYREEGIAEGRKEKSMDMAKQLKEYGMDINTISKMTGLSVTDIEKI